MFLPQKYFYLLSFLVNKGSLISCELMNDTKIFTFTISLMSVIPYLILTYVNIVERSCGEKPTSIAKKSFTASRLAVSQQDIEKVLRTLTTEKSGLDFWLYFSCNQSIKV